jgi:hypothetical protein
MFYQGLIEFLFGLGYPLIKLSKPRLFLRGLQILVLVKLKVFSFLINGRVITL